MIFNAAQSRDLNGIMKGRKHTAEIGFFATASKTGLGSSKGKMRKLNEIDVALIQKLSIEILQQIDQS